MRWVAILAPLAHCCATVSCLSPAFTANTPSVFLSHPVLLRGPTNGGWEGSRRRKQLDQRSATRGPCSARYCSLRLIDRLPGLAAACGGRASSRTGRGLAMSCKPGEGGERDRGQSGSLRRDIRVFVGGEVVRDMAVGATVAFTGDQSHYLRKVMRGAEGSEVKVFDGVSGEWWCRIESRGGRYARARPTQPAAAASRPA